MEFQRLTSPTDPRFAEAIALYRQSFPYHEQRENASQVEALVHPDYHFDLIYDGNAFAGLLLYWETQDFIYVEHFCIEPALRGCSYGQKALALLAQKGKPIVLEIDPPVDELTRRRKAFYERSGYRANPYPHVHPPYHGDCQGHPLVVLSFPGELSAEAYTHFHTYLFKQVMKGI